MIILDTNVVSEPFKSAPDPYVLNWLNAQEAQTLYLTAINWAELLSGVETLPTGRRRNKLALALNTQVLALFSNRVLAFDAKAAEQFAKAHTSAQSQGNSIGFADCAIASIAKANGYAVATRNTKDFKGTGIALINPWTDS